MSYGVRLHVWGERACFTRPEVKVERVFYDVMTPSAAEGILEGHHSKAAPCLPATCRPISGTAISAGCSTILTSGTALLRASSGRASRTASSMSRAALLQGSPNDRPAGTQ